jgi:hypothetical protein
MNEALMDSVIDNDQDTKPQETISEAPSPDQQICRDVFLTSSFDGGISLFDRRVDGIVARLAPGPKGTPPWCTSVFSPFLY